MLLNLVTYRYIPFITLILVHYLRTIAALRAPVKSDRQTPAFNCCAAQRSLASYQLTILRRALSYAGARARLQWVQSSPIYPIPSLVID